MGPFTILLILGGAVLGASFGLVLARVRASRRKASVVVYLVVGLVVGLLLGGGAAGLLHLIGKGRDGPSHGYANRGKYRDAEMEAQMERLHPLIAALKKYRAQRGRYPAKLEELVTEKYLDTLPATKVALDHQGQPNRLVEDETGFGYLVSPTGDAFVVTIHVTFSEEPPHNSRLRLERFYRAGALSWEPGQPPPFSQPGELARPPMDLKK